MRLKNPGFGGIRGLRFNQPLTGVQNGLNRFFTTAEKFRYDLVEKVEPVFKRNGQTVYLGIEIKEINESSGVGTGYDTVEYLKAPKKSDKLTIDYLLFD